MIRIGKAKAQEGWFQYHTGTSHHIMNNKNLLTNLQSVNILVEAPDGTKSIYHTKETLEIVHNGKTLRHKECLYDPSYSNLISGHRLHQQKKLCVAMHHLALQCNRHVICVPYVPNIVLPCMRSQFPPTSNLLCNALHPIPTSLTTYSECPLLFMNTNSHFISPPFLANAHYHLCTKPRILFLIFSYSEFHFPLHIRWPISYSPSRLDYIKLATLSLEVTLFPLAYLYTTHHSSHSKHDNRHDYSLSNSSLVPEISNVQPLLSHLATQSSTHPLLYVLRLSISLPRHVALDCPPNPGMLHRLT